MVTKKITRKVKVIELDTTHIRKRYVYNGGEDPSIAEIKKYYFTANDNITRYFTITENLVAKESYFTFNTETKVLTDRTGAQISYQTTVIADAVELPWNDWADAPKWSEEYVHIGALARNVFCNDGNTVEYKLNNLSPDPESITEAEISQIFATVFDE